MVELLKEKLFQTYFFFIDFFNSLKLNFYSTLEKFNLQDFSFFFLIGIFFVLYFLVRKGVSNNRIFLVLFYFPGTVIHELSHRLAALLTGGKILKFKILPEFNGETITFGSVTSSYKYKWRVPIVSTAPLFLNLSFLIFFMNLLYPDINEFFLFNSWKDFLFSYICAIVLASSLLSSVDLNACFRNIFNFISITFIITIILLALFLKEDILIIFNTILSPYNIIIENSILFFLLLSFILIIINYNFKK